MGKAIEKRIQVTPSPSAGPVIRELSRLTGKPASSVIRELLDETLPALLPVLDALRVVKSKPELAQAAMADLTTRAIHQVTQAQLDLAEAMKKRPGRKPAGHGAGATGPARPSAKKGRKRSGRGAAKTG